MSLDKMLPRKSTLDIKTAEAQLHSFESQWAQLSQFEVNGKRIKVFDIKPEKQKTNIPTLVVPGWGATPNVFKENLRVLANSKRRSISVEAPHGIEHETQTPENMGEFADTEVRRIAAFMQALDAAGVEKANAIGHSQGGLDVVIAAEMYPERFENIVLVDPAGMIGSDRMRYLAARFTMDAIKGFARSLRDGTVGTQLKIGSELTKTLSPHPKQSFDQVRTFAAADILQHLENIKAHGIGIIIIHGADDGAFPMERAQQEIQKRINEGVGKDSEQRSTERLEKITEKFLDGFVSVKGTHADFIVHAPEYTRIAEGALSALEQKKSNKEQVA